MAFYILSSYGSSLSVARDEWIWRLSTLKIPATEQEVRAHTAREPREEAVGPGWFCVVWTLQIMIQIRNVRKNNFYKMGFDRLFSILDHCALLICSTHSIRAFLPRTWVWRRVRSCWDRCLLSSYPRLLSSRC